MRPPTIDDRAGGVVDERAQVVEHRAEPDDGRLERDADAGGLIGELLHPVVVHAGGRRVGGEALRPGAAPA